MSGPPIPADAIARVRAGDLDAFAEVVTAYARPVRTWLALHAPGGVDCEELCHLAFVEAYYHLDRWPAATDPLPWLLGIARNLLRMETRRWSRQQRARRSAADDLRRQWMEARMEAEPRAPEEELAALRRCLGELPEDGVDLLRGRYERGDAVDALAAASGRSVAAVKFRLHWLRAKLAECIAGRLAREPA